MPTYSYVCRDCGYEFDAYQTMSADVLTECPECKKSSLRRKIGRGAGVIFKGSGFYCTDYKGANASDGAHESSCACKGCKHNK